MKNRVICDKATLECIRKKCPVARLHNFGDFSKLQKFTCKDINSRYKAVNVCEFKEIEWKSLRDYQQKLAHQGACILNTKGLVYLAFEPRVGKTYTAFRAAELAGAKNVFFMTTANALKDIIIDWDCLIEKPSYNIDIFNYDMLHHYKHIADYNDDDTILIVDESHQNGAYPKMNIMTKQIKAIAKGKRIILMSGTPTPEGHSQIFHQLHISRFSPFNDYRDFYAWVKDYVDVKIEKFYGVDRKNYDHAKQDKIMAVIDDIVMPYTREQAGFKYEVKDRIINVPMNPNINKLIEIMLKDRVYYFKGFNSKIVSDSKVKLMNHIHQLSSGTIKTADEQSRVLDNSKALFIKEHYRGQKIAIFYNYVAEGDILKATFPNWTANNTEFNISTDKVYINQIESGARGTSLASADVLIMYNIAYSAELYFQAMNRIQTYDRDKQPEVHWLFNSVGIEHEIYEKVKKKQNYTSVYFERDMRRKINNQVYH